MWLVGSRLYVGTSGGQLLVYEVPTEKQEGRYTVELKDSKKNLTANKVGACPDMHCRIASNCY